MTCGVYKITNLANGKLYVGSSRDIESRIRQHLQHLTRNKHHSVLLQRAFNKYGSENFWAETIEVCPVEILLDREQYYMDLHQSYVAANGYNISKHADCPNRDPLSPSHKRHISEGLRKSGWHPTQAHKDILSECLRNRVFTPEMRHNMSVAHLGKRPTNLEQLRLFNTGRKHPEDQNKAQSVYNKTHNVKPSKLALDRTIETNQKTYGGVISPDGEVFYSITNMKKFCREHNLISTRMFALMKGKKKQHHGWVTLDYFYSELT